MQDYHGWVSQCVGEIGSQAKLGSTARNKGGMVEPIHVLPKMLTPTGNMISLMFSGAVRSAKVSSSYLTQFHDWDLLRWCSPLFQTSCGSLVSCLLQPHLVWALGRNLFPSRLSFSTHFLMVQVWCPISGSPFPLVCCIFSVPRPASFICLVIHTRMCSVASHFWTPNCQFRFLVFSNRDGFWFSV